jgi:CRP/FNR family transcriptional regulator, cyclic AMP receptor protein
MDTTGFFNYPTISAAAEDAPERGFLAGATMEEWDAVLAATETLRFHPGDVVLRAGERDRAFYVLIDGRLQLEDGSEAIAPTALGAGAFLDGEPRAVTLRARGHGELARMSWEAYEGLAARDARLGRAILVELGRLLAVHLRTAGAAGWTG